VGEIFHLDIHVPRWCSTASRFDWLRPESRVRHGDCCLGFSVAQPAGCRSYPCGGVCVLLSRASKSRESHMALHSARGHVGEGCQSDDQSARLYVHRIINGIWDEEKRPQLSLIPRAMYCVGVLGFIPGRPLLFNVRRRFQAGRIDPSEERAPS